MPESYDDPRTSEAAALLWALLERHGELSRETALNELKNKFGPGYLDRNEQGDPSIPQAVRYGVYLLSAGRAMWVDHGPNRKFWRLFGFERPTAE
jgi:hypothetical protein